MHGGVDDLRRRRRLDRGKHCGTVPGWVRLQLLEREAPPRGRAIAAACCSALKPVRMAPYRWSPAKVEAGKKLIEGFIQDGIMGPISSEWAWPGLLVPKPKGGWRFVVDLRELNKLIPHDTYEPPSCDSS